MTASGALPALVKRVIAAAIMIPVALLAVWTGSPWLVLLTMAASGAMVWEWSAMLAARGFSHHASLATAIGMAVIPIAAQFGPLPAIGVTLLGAVLVTLMENALEARLWNALGLIWIVFPCIAFIWLRSVPGSGLALIVWLLVVIWAVDIGAYAFGRSIGGARLAPSISPNKTWAGLLGGVMSAIVAGALVTKMLGFHGWLQCGMASGVLAVVEQMGDLVESYAKRRFGVKDSGNMIPGHGGVLDRLDGALTATSALALLQISGWNWR